MTKKEISNIFLQQAAKILQEQNNLVAMPKTAEATQQLLYDLQVENLALRLECEAGKKLCTFCESPLQFQSIVEQSFESIGIADLNGNYVFVNDAFAEMMGYAKIELLSMAVFDLRSTLEIPTIFEGTKAKGNTIDEIFLKRKDGSFFLASIRGKVITVGNDKFILGIVNDITAQRAQEINLAKTKETFELAINGTSAGIWDWKNINEDEEWWSPQFYYMLGYTPDELPSSYSSLKKILHPAHSEAVFDLVQQHFEHKIPFDIEIQLLTKSGEYKWFRSTAISQRDELGKPKRMVGSIVNIHDRKLAEAELQSIKKTLELALEGSNAGVWTREGENLEEGWWSPNFYKLLGYENNEVYPSPTVIATLIHPEDIQMVFNLLVMTPKEQHIVPFNIEYRLKTKQGQYRWFKDRGIAERNSEGLPIKLIGTIIDIHDEKNKELLFLKQQYALEHTQEISSIGSWELDIKIGLLTWTKENYKIFGVPCGTPLTYEIFLNQIYPDDRDYVNEEWTKSIAQKTPYDIVHRLLVNGEIKWVREKATVYYDENGNATNAIGFTQDVTKFKKIEAALKESEGYLKKGAEIAQLGFWKYIPKTKLIEYSTEFIKIYELDHASPSNVMNSIHPDDLLLCKYHIEEGLKNGTPWDIQHRLLFSDGRIKWLRGKGEPMMDKDGKTFCIVGTIQDITKEKSLEIALRQSKEESDKNAKVKENFLANMSHEIRTPMNGVLGFSRLLLETHLDNTQRSYAEAIYGSAENLLVIVNDILDVSKIESGKMEMRKTAFDLLHKIDNTLKIFYVSTEEKGLYLRVHAASNLPNCVISAPDRIAQVLINLIGNAIKFTEKGGVDLYISIQNKTNLFFEIKDTGIGIPKEKLETIFEAFTQVENYKTREHGGTGLGLTISKQLVELMGGMIGVKSELHQGSTFYFSLPVVPCDTASIKHSDKNNALKRFQNVHVLVAEDHPINQKLALVYLDRLGCTHELVVNGEEAVIRTSEQRFDAILMDIQMPKMDGMEATRRIRKIDKNTPIIAMTAHALEKEKQNCFDIGMNDYLTKPFKIEELDAMLSKYILEKEPIQTTDSMPSAASESGFLTALKKMADDKELLMDLLEILEVELVKFTEEVRSSVADLNLDKIIEIQHKTKPSFEIFKLSKQADLLRTIRKLLEEKSSNIIIQEYFQELEKSIPPLIKTIEQLKIEN